jgi:hypothetical protein
MQELTFERGRSNRQNYGQDMALNMCADDMYEGIIRGGPRIEWIRHECGI